MPNNRKKKQKKKQKKRSVRKASASLRGNRTWYKVAGTSYHFIFNAQTTRVGLLNATSGTTRAVVKAQKHVSAAGRFLARAKVANNVKNINRGTKWVKYAEKSLGKAQAGTGYGSQMLKFVDKWAVPVAVVIDVARTGYSATDDYSKGTTRNTVNTAANIAGGWAGGYGGAMGGAVVGSILPGVGTLIGGICGAIYGGFKGSELGSAIAEKVGDKYEYDIELKHCILCHKEFKARVYLGENICNDCRQKLELQKILLPLFPKSKSRNSKRLEGSKSYIKKRLNTTPERNCNVCDKKFKFRVLEETKCDDCEKKEL